MVQDTQNVLYRVELDSMMDCTCVYLQKKCKPCKHVCFIITQVAKGSMKKYKHDSLLLDGKKMVVLEKLLLKRLSRRYKVKSDSNIAPLKVNLK